MHVVLILCVLALHTAAFPNVISFGSNVGGVAGRNTTTNAVDVDYVQTLGGQLENETVVSVAVGSASLVLTASGRLFVSGSNSYGQLGLNNTSITNQTQLVQLPSTVLANKTVSAITANAKTSYFATSDGNLYYTGYNFSTMSNVYAITLGPVTWMPVSTYITSMVSVGDCVLMLLNTGYLFGYGDNTYSQIGDNTASMRTIPVSTNGGRTYSQIGMGTRQSIALGTDGIVYTWGQNVQGSLGKPGATFKVPSPINYGLGNLSMGQTVTFVTAGKDSSIAITDDGKVYAFGAGVDGALCSNQDLSYATLVSASIFENSSIVKATIGFGYTLFLASNGRVYACGDRNKYSIGDGWSGGSDITYGKRVNSLEAYNVTNFYTYSDVSEATFAVLKSTQATPTPTPTPTPTTASPTTTAAPTTTVAPTTTDVPTTTVAPTTTAAPTTVAPTTAAPTTNAPTTTVAPTTVAPTTSVAPTTTAGPTTTLPPTLTTSPTTATPGPTNAPQTVSNSAQLTSQVTGDSSQVPPPVTSNSLVLFSNSSVSVSLPLSFQNITNIPQQSVVLDTTISFNINYVQSSAVVSVIVSDDFGNQVGRSSITVNKAGTYTVNLKDVISNLVQLYNQGFTIRVIRGNILKVSLGIDTQDVAINVSPDVSSTIVYATQQTATPAATTKAPQSTIPTTTKPNISAASAKSIGALMVLSMIMLAM